jgi:hypothetical protein
MSCIICDIKTKPCKKRAEAVAKWNERHRCERRQYL